MSGVYVACRLKTKHLGTLCINRMSSVDVKALFIFLLQSYISHSNLTHNDVCLHPTIDNRSTQIRCLSPDNISFCVCTMGFECASSLNIAA